MAVHIILEAERVHEHLLDLQYGGVGGCAQAMQRQGRPGANHGERAGRHW